MRRPTRHSLLALALLALLTLPATAGERVPGDTWMRYRDVAQAGFDAARLEAAHQAWKAMPSSAFLVVADGAVVAAWGDVDRRFMCHSVRKSFLSALYGIYWDRGAIELNKTLADLGLDDEPDPLLPIEKQARILDLLKARSGVFHPAAYAGRTDSQPRGSQGPGRYFAYNNWDFNTLAAILKQETGAEVFTAFDQFFGQPLRMQDWRVSDGYYHYERDKSQFPAYPFRMSARDAARFGLLFAREGVWGDQRILSRQWVRRSSALYSIDNDVMGYGFMWWIFREPRFERYGAYAAFGVGNQMIAVLPDIDLVIVNRANTYDDQFTPGEALRELIAQVLEARTTAPLAEPDLVPLEAAAPDPQVTRVAPELLAPFVGEWPDPPAPLHLPPQTTFTLTAGDGYLVGYSPLGGTFKLYLQPDGSFHQEDSYLRYVPVRDEAGKLAGVTDPTTVLLAAIHAAADGNRPRAQDLLAQAGDEGGLFTQVGRGIVDLLGGQAEKAQSALQELITDSDRAQIERMVNSVGYNFLSDQKTALARDVFALNTRLFPTSANAWDSLGEAQANLGDNKAAIGSYQRSLELNPNSNNACKRIEELSAKTMPSS